MLSSPLTDYRRRVSTEIEEFGINRYRRRDQAQRGFIQADSTDTTTRNRAVNPLSYLFQVPRANMLAPRGARRLVETRIQQRIGIETYRRTNELFQRDRGSVRRAANLYRRSNPALQRSVNLVRGTFGPSVSTGLSNRPFPNITRYVQQGIRQYQLIDGILRGNNELFRLGANFYL